MIESLKKLITLVMAGGKGERLYPLTQERTKPAVPFGGVYRIIDFTLSNCVNSGLRRIHVLCQYKSVSLARHLEAGWNIFHSELGERIELLPAQQRYGDQWYRGTADAVYQNIYTIQREDPEYVLILAGDHVYKMDFFKMLRAHILNRADVTVGTVEVHEHEGNQFGILEVDEQNQIIGFEEKPEKPKTLPGRPNRVYASMGIYIFNTEIIYEELIPDAQSESSHDFGKDIIPKMLGRRKLLAYSFVDENMKDPPYWRDIGTLDAYYRANMDLVAVDPHFNLYDKRWPIRTYQPQFPPAKTVFADEGPDARRGLALDSVISNGCIISGGKVVRSVLSPQVRINSYASVEDSVLMESVQIGRHAKVRRAIVDKYVEILPGTKIGYDLDSDRSRFHVTKSGIVVIPKDRIVGPDDIHLRWPDRIHDET